eukprot:1215957-Pleurochrysis_carterae.AAC.2
MIILTSSALPFCKEYLIKIWVSRTIFTTAAKGNNQCSRSRPGPPQQQRNPSGGHNHRAVLRDASSRNRLQLALGRVPDIHNRLARVPCCYRQLCTSRSIENHFKGHIK